MFGWDDAFSDSGIQTGNKHDLNVAVIPSPIYIWIPSNAIVLTTHNFLWSLSTGRDQTVRAWPQFKIHEIRNIIAVNAYRVAMVDQLCTKDFRDLRV